MKLKNRKLLDDTIGYYSNSETGSELDYITDDYDDSIVDETYMPSSESSQDSFDIEKVIKSCSE